MASATVADMATGTFQRHWLVLKDAWALESQRLKTAHSWRETDFLPAALEVIETPPNPLGRAILWTLMTFLVLALIWSSVAKLDVVAVAPGKVIAAGRNKLVQAADGGVVGTIYVRDGQIVRKGQPLLTLDPTATGADQAQAVANLQTAQIDAARSRALLAGLAGRPATFIVPAGLPEGAAATQRELIGARLLELNAKVSGLREQALEAKATGGAARAEVSRLRDTLPFLVDRVERRRQLADKGYASKLGQSELEQQRVDHERQIAVQAQNAARATASIGNVAAQIAEARSTAQREVLADLTKAEADIRLAREELTKADQKARQQIIRAPVDGTVQQLSIYTEGAVLKPADPILVIVPSKASLVIEAQVLNRDIGFVRPGQEVTIKLEAFPFTRYGTLRGRLVMVSTDAVQDDKLGPVYQARVEVDSIQASSSGIILAPGLQTTAEIKTSSRRVIDFLLSPIERRVSEAGRER